MSGLDELGLIMSNFLIEEAEDASIQRFVRQPQDCFELPEKKFVKLFRINKHMADDFINQLEPYMNEKTRISSLSPEEKILGALRFFASGSYQQDVGQNYNISLSQSSMSRSINEVINAVHTSGLFTEKIKFYQTVNDINNARQSYYDVYGFPGVIGCIDCTHVAIVPPPKEDALFPAHIYVNRKGYHSINVQLVCDANMKILSVNARYPGSTHDSFIWNNSNVLSAMKQIHQTFPGSYYLLGDSGYALRPWMLTPIRDAVVGSPEGDYNDCQIATRNIIERVNGVLKMRFRCLLKHRVLHYHPQTASKIINTCCVLHYLCVKNNLPEVSPEQGDSELDVFDGINVNDNSNDQFSDGSLLERGKELQRRIVRRYFT